MQPTHDMNIIIVNTFRSQILVLSTLEYYCGYNDEISQLPYTEKL